MEHGLLPKEMPSATITENLTKLDLSMCIYSFIPFEESRVGRLPVRNSMILPRAGALSAFSIYSSPHDHSCHSPGHHIIIPKFKHKGSVFVLWNFCLGIRKKIYPRSLTSLPSSSHCPRLGYMNVPKPVTGNVSRSL